MQIYRCRVPHRVLPPHLPLRQVFPWHRTGSGTAHPSNPWRSFRLSVRINQSWTRSYNVFRLRTADWSQSQGLSLTVQWSLSQYRWQDRSNGILCCRFPYRLTSSIRFLSAQSHCTYSSNPAWTVCIPVRFPYLYRYQTGSSYPEGQKLRWSFQGLRPFPATLPWWSDHCFPSPATGHRHLLYTPGWFLPYPLPFLS